MEQAKAGAQIEKKAFVQAVVILLVLMILAGFLTRVVPAGSYTRSMVDGREVIDTRSFHYTHQQPYPVWRWVTAPVEVLWGPDAAMVIAIILFILTVGGSFAVLDKSGVLKAVIARIAGRFASRRYLLLALVSLFFMALGGLLGIFEEVIPLIPMALALAYSLGWDSLTGLGMSLLAAGFGFAAAVSNPFSIGVAQRIAGLPAFSGAWFRVIIFASVYACLALFLTRHARRVEKNPERSPVFDLDQKVKNKYRLENLGSVSSSPKGATRWLAAMLLVILVFFLLTPFVQALSAVSLPLTGLLFLVAGVGAGLFAGLKGKGTGRAFIDGVSGMAPGVVLILMAMSVKLIITRGGIMDTVLHGAASVITHTNPVVAAFLVYLVTLLLEFFVGSASAKAFLVVPIIAPLADLVGLTRQSAVLAYCFGDGFSNLIYPTNAVLLVALGLTTVSYPRWIRWTLPLQVAVFFLTLAFLAVAVLIGLGPF